MYAVLTRPALLTEDQLDFLIQRQTLRPNSAQEEDPEETCGLFVEDVDCVHLQEGAAVQWGFTFSFGSDLDEFAIFVGPFTPTLSEVQLLALGTSEDSPTGVLGPSELLPYGTWFHLEQEGDLFIAVVEIAEATAETLEILSRMADTQAGDVTDLFRLAWAAEEENQGICDVYVISRTMREEVL